MKKTVPFTISIPEKPEYLSSFIRRLFVGVKFLLKRV